MATTRAIWSLPRRGPSPSGRTFIASLLLNDDYTPMEFVVHVVERFFQKNREEATRIMLHVHHHGVGECGVFTYEVAETKVTQVMDFARKHQHPLAMRDGKEIGVARAVILSKP